MNEERYGFGFWLLGLGFWVLDLSSSSVRVSCKKEVLLPPTSSHNAHNQSRKATRIIDAKQCDDMTVNNHSMMLMQGVTLVPPYHTTSIKPLLFDVCDDGPTMVWYHTTTTIPLCTSPFFIIIIIIITRDSVVPQWYRNTTSPQWNSQNNNLSIGPTLPCRVQPWQ